MEEISLYIQDNITESLTDLEKSITDLKVILLATIESLTVLSEAGQADFKRNIESLQERMLMLMGGGLFESIFARLKEHLSMIATANNPTLYLPLEGCYDSVIFTENRFSVLKKVTFYLANPDKKTLLILGEAGTGKTCFSIYLSQYLLKTPLFSTQGYRILPLYISVSRIPIAIIKNNRIEYLLKEYYNFSAQEMKLLLEGKQPIFCFIFDDIDEPDVNLSWIQDLYLKFPGSCCVFTACSSRFKCQEDGEKLLMSLNGKKEQHEKIIHIVPFNEMSKKNYIREFLLLKEKVTFLSSVYLEVERIYRQIKMIPYLNDIIGQAIFLMMIMEVFPYLGGFCQQKKIISNLKDLKDDLFHMYTHLLYVQAADKIKQTKGISAVNGRSIYDCILSYTIKLAQLMTATGIREINEDLLFASESLLHTVAGSSSDFPNIFLQLTSEQYREYKRCFAKKYDPQLFKDGKDFKTYKYGYQGCVFLHSYGVAPVYHRFRHAKFLNYFCTFDKERRDEIRGFIDNYKVFDPLYLQKMRRSSIPDPIKFEKMRRSSIPHHMKFEKGHPLQTYYSSDSTHVKHRKQASLRSSSSSAGSGIIQGEEVSLQSTRSAEQTNIGEYKGFTRRQCYSTHVTSTLFAPSTSRVAGRSSYFSSMIDPTLDDVTSDVQTAQSGFL